VALLGTWTYTATFNATQANIDNGQDILTNASVTTNQTAPASPSASTITVVMKSPALSIIKSANVSGPVKAGDVISYQYRVQNTGNVTILGVKVSDVHNGYGLPPLPSNENLFQDASPAGDSVDSGQNGNWDSLAPGDEVVFSSTYTVDQLDIDRLQ
jgi:large repetitive protein